MPSGRPREPRSPPAPPSLSRWPSPAAVAGSSVNDDIETATTTCWALKNSGVQLAQIAVDDDNKPLPNTGEALRTKQLMAAGVQTFCPDYDGQVSQLKLP